MKGCGSAAAWGLAGAGPAAGRYDRARGRIARANTRNQLILLAFGLFAALLPTPGAARQLTHCTEAARFLERADMVLVTEPDTIDDWRTGTRQPGCRITAAGRTSRPMADEATRFFEQVRAAGWTRTPDPRDAPGESSLRFRKEGSDCLFSVYEGARLLTEAERKVMTEAARKPGVVRMGVLVTCTAALPASNRRP